MADSTKPTDDESERRKELETYYAALSGDERRQRIVLEPAFRDAYNEITQAHQVVQLPRYFWDKWVPVLGPTTTTVYVNLRKHCYYNSRTGEIRDNWQTRQETLARECGIKDRKTLRKCLVVLESAGFIKRTPDHSIDPRTGRPYRTTDLYQVFYEVPLVDQDAVELLLRRVGSAAQTEHDRVMRKSSPLHPPTTPDPVDSPAVKGRFSSPAREIIPSKRVYLESVLKNVNVATRTKEQLIHTSDMAQQILEQLGDRHSMGFYRKVAQRVPSEVVYRALSETKEARHGGQVVNAAAYFTARVKQLAAERGIQL
jgi:DNA-binding HxlR family transcriptional regulator